MIRFPLLAHLLRLHCTYRLLVWPLPHLMSTLMFTYNLTRIDSCHFVVCFTSLGFCCCCVCSPGWPPLSYLAEGEPEPDASASSSQVMEFQVFDITSGGTPRKLEPFHFQCDSCVLSITSSLLSSLSLCTSLTILCLLLRKPTK